MAAYDRSARKRPVNLTLNEDLVAQARSMTDNLSGMIESLLAEFLAAEKEAGRSSGANDPRHR